MRLIMRHEIEEQEEGRFSKQALMVIIPLAVILLLIIFCVVKIMVWNKGKAFHYDGPGDTSSLDSESEDYFAAMDPALLADRPDDGLQILFLGDDMLTYGGSTQSIPNQVSIGTGATVYNCGFPQSTLASRNLGFDEEYCNDVFSFVRLAYCIKSGDYTLVDYYKEYADIYDSSFDTAINTLENIDFNQIDVIFLAYGTYDYLNGYMTTDVTNDSAANAVTGALNAGITAIREAYPHIRFVVMSPTFCYYDEGDGTMTQADLRRVGVTDEALGGYIVAMKAICVQLNVSFLDDYFGFPLDAQTAQQYLDDAIHVNDDCRKLLADKVIDYIKTKMY